MVEALHEILTNADARTSDAVSATLVEQTSAGTPWGNES